MTLNCRVTGTSAKVINTFGRDKTGKYHTGCDIQGDLVYSICNGVVIDVSEQSDKHFIATIQHSENACIRYGHLLAVVVPVGKPILDEYLLGCAEDFVHFEYCVRDAEDKTFPVRVGSQTYYKVDPFKLVTGELRLSRTAIQRTQQQLIQGKRNPLGYSDDMFAEVVGG